MNFSSFPEEKPCFSMFFLSFFQGFQGPYLEFKVSQGFSRKWSPWYNPFTLTHVMSHGIFLGFSRFLSFFQGFQGPYLEFKVSQGFSRMWSPWYNPFTLTHIIYLCSAAPN